MRVSNRHIGNRGVTLIELLVALAIAAILIGAGIPSFLSMIQRSNIDGATRQVMYEIRTVQNLAVTRGGVFGFHWGADPMVGMATSVYRVERDPSGICAAPPNGWPAPGDTTATVCVDGAQCVIRDWFDLATEYTGVTIQSVTDGFGNPVGGVMFNSRGASLNNCGPVTFPMMVTVADTSGATRIIRVERAGRVFIQ